MLLFAVVFFILGIFVGVKLEKKDTELNKKWVDLKKWFRNLVRDKVK